MFAECHQPCCAIIWQTKIGLHKNHQICHYQRCKEKLFFSWVSPIFETFPPYFRWFQMRGSSGYHLANTLLTTQLFKLVITNIDGTNININFHNSERSLSHLIFTLFSRPSFSSVAPGTRHQACTQVICRRLIDWIFWFNF